MGIGSGPYSARPVPESESDSGCRQTGGESQISWTPLHNRLIPVSPVAVMKSVAWVHWVSSPGQ